MKTALNTLMLSASAAFFTGISSAAHATGQTQGPNMSDISQNIMGSMSDLPGVISAFSYVLGIGFGLGGIIKLKDHVDNPTNTQLKEGAIRLAAGGALFSLPFVLDVMNDMISGGVDGGQVKGPALNRVNETNLLR